MQNEIVSLLCVMKFIIFQDEYMFVCLFILQKINKQVFILYTFSEFVFIWDGSVLLHLHILEQEYSLIRKK